MSFVFTEWKKHIKQGEWSFAAHLDVMHTILISRIIYLLPSIFVEPDYHYVSVLP